jgi:hypothetical protein
MPSRRTFAIALASIATSLSLTPAANAGALVDSVTCNAMSVGQVFLPWADVAQYQQAPGGTAESLSGWATTGDVSVANGNEPWNVAGTGSNSIRLGSGGSTATTASMCVGVEHPTLRFFARSSSASLFSSLRVEVLFEDLVGNIVPLQIGSVTASGSWTPTPVYVVAANLLSVLPGDETAVAFRFTPVGGASWQIDDIHVDPWGRG